MSVSFLIVVVGILLGLAQLAAGIAIGYWLRRPTPGSRDADLHRTRTLALELHGLTQKIGTHVADHRSRFLEVESRLTAAPRGKANPTTDLVVGVVGEILGANRLLQEELLRAEQQIAEQAREIETHLTSSLTDSLTKLPNRRALDEQLATRLADYRKHGTPFSLLLVDIDRFKSINDSFGHPVGDEVLVSIGRALRGALRKHDFVARFGGEEFAVILPHTTLDEAQRAAEKARLGIAASNAEFQHLDRTITGSGGLASILPGEQPDELIARADEALYLAKRQGRDRTCLHDGNQCLELDHDLTSGTAWQQPENAAQQLPPAEPNVDTSEALAEACDELRAALAGSTN